MIEISERDEEVLRSIAGRMGLSYEDIVDGLESIARRSHTPVGIVIGELGRLASIETVMLDGLDCVDPSVGFEIVRMDCDPMPPVMIDVVEQALDDSSFFIGRDKYKSGSGRGKRPRGKSKR